MCGELFKMKNRKVAIITCAGISSRFNEKYNENQKKLKCIYNDGNLNDTILYHLIKKVENFYKIIIVGGYKFESLQEYCNYALKDFSNVEVIRNNHYDDLASGYSLCLGIEKAMEYSPTEVLFVEGDLDIDDESFEKIIKTTKDVITYTYEPIYAKKAVVLLINGDGKYKYAFNREHGLLYIDEPFSAIFNSGQIWKFTNMQILKNVNKEFMEEHIGETNLKIVQRYIDSIDCKMIELCSLIRWTNCNTREDYDRILNFWRNM